MMGIQAAKKRFGDSYFQKTTLNYSWKSMNAIGTSETIFMGVFGWFSLMNNYYRAN